MQRLPYSYRNDPAVPPFDDTSPLVIFDGHCVLCSAGIDWMLARDPDGTSRFAVIQDAIPRALYDHYGFDANTFDTFMVLDRGMPYTRWQGVIAAGRTLPWPWAVLSAIARLVPNAIGDHLYDWVQRHRISWFGARDVCRRPNEKERARFLNSDGNPAWVAIPAEISQSNAG
ncbi:hypothetical protein DLM45_00915 [Hyphomicrobium methylovorum]|uniref:thiol-disulfide oxidoreductase DCC family protein n=1 Tax=Hyphomicrobium methylovorum TaxID=84 RepID=UPI0015E6F85C|nr:DCC1-like thiol-disulfide oxidoreductase family protein [Hyphomicrobium methylovorum]MBA2124785.1 hypothetical protein [Hyphomicrobium methylovorum]